MSGNVIIRKGYSIDGAGCIRYQDAPASWDIADSLAGKRVDRRRSYAVIDGGLCELVRYSGPCSGCFEAPECTWYNMETAKGFGCTECGFTGRRRNSEYIPHDVAEAGRDL